MDPAPEENEVTTPMRSHVDRLRIGPVETADAVPPGRFFKGAEAILRQRFVMARDFALFEGHFPGNPILPALGQIILARSCAEYVRGEALAIAAIGQAKFLAPVEPEDVLDVFFARSRERDDAWLFHSFRLRDGETAEAARIKMTLRRAADA